MSKYLKPILYGITVTSALLMALGLFAFIIGGVLLYYWMNRPIDITLCNGNPTKVVVNIVSNTDDKNNAHKNIKNGITILAYQCTREELKEYPINDIAFYIGNKKYADTAYFGYDFGFIVHIKGDEVLVYTTPLSQFDKLINKTGSAF